MIFHAVAAAFDDNGVGMMKEAVEDGGGDGAVVIENGGPLFGGFVRGQNNGTALVSLANPTFATGG